MAQTSAQLAAALNTQREAIVAELAAVTALQLEFLAAEPKPTYNVSGKFGAQSFDWNGYYNYLNNLEKLCVEKLERLTNLIQRLTLGQTITIIR